MKIDYNYLNANILGSNEPDVLMGVESEEEAFKLGTVKYKLTYPQTQFMKLDCPFPLFIGGYGSGKTTVKILSGTNDLTTFPGSNIGMYEPTYDLIGLNTAPRLEELLTDLEMPYKYNKQKQKIQVEGHGSFIMRSMNNPERIVGYEVFRSHVDEIGVVSPSKVTDIWNKIVARNRQSVYVLDQNDRKVIDIHTRKPLTEVNKISAYGTPDDGFGFTYNMWGKDPLPGYEYVRASTNSNAFNIPDEYIKSLYALYPAGLVDAFLEGIWTNFTSGSVYFCFDREVNSTNITVSMDQREQLHIGMDFNVYNMAAVVGVLRKGKLSLCDEFIGLRDTPDMIKAIQNRYPNHNVIVYPDASGNSKSSKDSTLSDHKLLKEAGFKVKSRKSNPHIRDRVAAMNASFEFEKVAVNVDTCIQTTEAIEQQTYDSHGMPDKSTGADHPNDAAGYLINWLFGLTRPKVSTIGVKNI